MPDFNGDIENDKFSRQDNKTNAEIPKRTHNIVGLIYLRHQQRRRKMRNYRIWNKVGEFDVNDLEEDDDDQLLSLKYLGQLTKTRPKIRSACNQKAMLAERVPENWEEQELCLNNKMPVANRSRSATVSHPANDVRKTECLSRTLSVRDMDSLDDARILSPNSLSAHNRSLSIRVDEIEEDDPRLMKRAYALSEILFQEKVFVSSLKELISDFLEVIELQDILEPSTQQQFQTLISDKIKGMLGIHQELEAALERENQMNGRRLVSVFEGDVLIKISCDWAGQFHRITHSDALDLYKVYISNYDSMIHMIESERENNPQFFKFLRDKEKARKSFFSFLILPVQQITRYRLTFKELQKCCDESDPDWHEINYLTTRFEECPKHINEYKKENIERMTKLSHIMSLISDMPESVLDDQRRYIEQIKVRKPHKSAFSTSKYNRLFLFNDILIVTNQRYRFRRYHNISNTNLAFIEPQTFQIEYTDNGKIHSNKWTVLNVTVASEFHKKYHEARSYLSIEEESDNSSYSEISASYSQSAFESTMASMSSDLVSKSPDHDIRRKSLTTTLTKARSTYSTIDMYRTLV